jgi:pilus assembly protein FimV
MPMRLIWILLLALACGPALALGLGQIEVKSRHGQPLLAEIPIVSSDPSELEQLQARLASPETFRRIGLEPPAGTVADLQFAIALDPQGRPVIRITTQQPVQEPLLTFLVEVDWGQGRLVREYSALVDSPRTVAAPLQPPIQVPEAAPTDLIVRPAETAPTELAEESTETPATPEAVAAQPEDAPSPSTARTPPPAPAPRAPAGGGGPGRACWSRCARSSRRCRSST